MSHFANRMKQFQALIKDRADLVFIPISADLHYLTGVPRDIPSFGWTMHPGAWLEGAWITPDQPPVLTLPRMTAEFGGLMDRSDVDLRVLGDHDKPDDLVWNLLKTFDLPIATTIALGDRAHAETVVHLQALLPSARFISGTDMVRELRLIQGPEEIELMREAGRITESAFADVIKNLRHGMTELELITEINFQLRRHGSLGESFPTALYNSSPTHPLIFGNREKSMPRPMQAPISILTDFGAIHQGLCYDFGRTIFFGEPPAEARRVHELIMQSQKAGIAALKADENTTTQADAAARKVIEDAGYGETFRHRLGHGIGMDVHEPPFLTAGDNTMLREGMLFTIEPSIMQFNNFSARVEDIVVARPGGGEALTSGFQDLIVID